MLLHELTLWRILLHELTIIDNKTVRTKLRIIIMLIIIM